MNESSNFSPGPWSWQSPNVYDDDLDLIAYLLSGNEQNGPVIAAAWLIPDLLDAVGQITHAIGLGDANELANGHESARRVYEKARKHGYLDLSA